MRAKTIALDVSYSQIAVFSSDLPDPFNHWTDEHVAQGFSWRPGSVSFATLVESGPHHVTVTVLEGKAPLSTGAVRAIEVPFEVPASGEIEIASISDSSTLILPAGMYQLRYELLSFGKKDTPAANLTFWLADDPLFVIALADSAS